MLWRGRVRGSSIRDCDSGRTHRLALPLPRQFLKLCQHLLNVLHALGDAVGHRGRNGRLVMPEDESGTFQRAQPFRQHAGGNAVDLLSEDPEAQGAVVAQGPQNVKCPGTREQFQHPTDGTWRRSLRGSPLGRHIDTRLLQSSYNVKRSQLFIVTNNRDSHLSQSLTVFVLGNCARQVLFAFCETTKYSRRTRMSATTSHFYPSTSARPQVVAVSAVSGLTALIGRFLFVLIFVLSGPRHFMSQTIAYASSQGVPLASIAVPLSGVLALAGGLSILLGYRARIGAWLVVLFLVGVTPAMHNFWAVKDPMMAQIQMIMFLKNLSMLGGALLVSQFGAGPWSLDARKNSK